MVKEAFSRPGNALNSSHRKTPYGVILVKIKQLEKF
jgi:hypothetical protein